MINGSIDFVALGGIGEIGMNLYLYGHRGKWLMADLGLTFADDTAPGIDVLVPDPIWIEEQQDDLVGLVLTHVHEDHLGAVPYLWQRLRCPIYATKFTAAVLRRKLHENDFEAEIPIHVVEPGAAFQIDSFRVTMIGVTHSTPESQALLIETDSGTVLHSGDWKFDSGPQIGAPTDLERLRQVGDEGVLAFLCDSTNATTPGRSGSEADVRIALEKLVAEQPQRVAITTFASNVARIKTTIEVAEATGRHLAVVGRALWRYIDIARATGYLDPDISILSEKEAGYVPREKVLLLCTGCQGESRGAMARIAGGGHPQIALEADDTVIFSSKIIPGNEPALAAVYNNLAAAKINVITEEDSFVHVSGHPCQDELAEMYRLIRPMIAIPMHGEARHLRTHAALARKWGVPEVLEVGNGDRIRLSDGTAEVIEQVPVGRLAVDETGLIEVGSAVLRTRRKMMYNGSAQVTLVLADGGVLAADPQVSVQGVAAPKTLPDAWEEIVDEIRAAVEALSKSDRKQDEEVEKVAAQALRRTVRRHCGRRPITSVHVVRL